MSRRTARRDALTAFRGAEMLMVAPLVASQRLLGMAAIGTGSREELFRMSFEKVISFQQSWMAMSMQAVRTQQQVMLPIIQSMWWPWTRLPWLPMANQIGNATMGVLGKGLVPVHRRVLANARRLDRARADRGRTR